MGKPEGFRLLGVRPSYYIVILCIGLLFAFSNRFTEYSGNRATVPVHKVHLATRERGSLDNAVATNYTGRSDSLRIAADEDEDYTCSPEEPCSNGACCGSTGVCGYGK